MTNDHLLTLDDQNLRSVLRKGLAMQCTGTRQQQQKGIVVEKDDRAL